MKTKAYLPHLLALLWSLWLVHALLRLCVLARPNAFGLPLVSKLDWYIFHAWCFDFRWILISLLPILFVYFFIKNKIQNRILTVLSLSWMAMMAIDLVLTVADHEMQRFMGGHLDFGLLSVYGNASAFEETLKFLPQDQSIPYLPLILFVGVIPLWLLSYQLCQRFFERASLKKWVWISVGFLLVGYLYTEVIWTGGHRAKKLAPVHEALYQSYLDNQKLALSPTQVTQMTQNWRRDWLHIESDSNWVFPFPQYPFWKTPINPSSVQKQPWNYIFLILESHRAVQVGHLKFMGAWKSCTPTLDSLAQSAHVWTRFNSGGVPTISALATTHLSILEHSRKYIASGFTHIQSLSFPQILRQNGFKTKFFSAADPAWDNQTPWLGKWYDSYFYSRETEEDQKLFHVMGEWLRDSSRNGQPFLATAMTKTNHYPFNPVEGVEPSPEGDMEARMCATMRYTEKGIQDLIESNRSQPWFNRTLWVIMADHGFSLGTHGSTDIGNGLYSEHTWIPFLIWSPTPHPALGAPALHQEAASQLDIAPTLLALNGIQQANAFQGHNLLRPNTTNAKALIIRGGQWMLETQDRRIHQAFLAGGRAQGSEIFDAFKDRPELHNLYKQEANKWQKDSDLATQQALLNIWTLEQNQLIPR